MKSQNKQSVWTCMSEKAFSADVHWMTIFTPAYQREATMECFYRTLITDVYSFTLPVTGNAVAASVTTIQLQGADIDFTSITLDSYNFTQTGFDPGQETWELSNINLGGGAHTLTLSGNKLGNLRRSYSGTIELAGVPEPAVWGMMLLGFGLVGSAMRSRKTTTTVVYA